MRIDKSRYESAKKKIADTEETLKKYRATVKKWEDAVRELQPSEGQEVRAVIIKDGRISGEIGRKVEPQLKTA